jgi:hypothetical protein
MFRFLGFLTGAALTIVALVMVLGPPELRDDLQTAAVDVAVPVAESLQSDAFQAALGDTLDEIVVTAKRLPEVMTMDDVPVFAARPASAAPVNAGTLPERLEPITEPPEFLAELPTVPGSAPQTPATALAEVRTPSDRLEERAVPMASAYAPNWQSIWNPFRSQVAANGFAARLAAVTDIDYRVVRLKPGGYQVAFAYTDDGERAAKLAQIQSATGLDLPEAVP